MKKLLLLVALGATSITVAQDEVPIPAADEWYKNQYAPLYGDKPWEMLDEILQHFAETMHYHDEGTHTVDAREWVAGALEGWKIQGWIRSELAELDYDLLNPTTASFKAKWRDYYSGGNINHECAWYLAGFTDGQWRISDYATISCSNHGM